MHTYLYQTSPIKKTITTQYLQIIGRWIQSYNNSSWEDSKTTEEIVVQAPVDSLEGVEFFWQAIFEAKEREIAEKAMEILIEIYSSLLSELKVVEIRTGTQFNLKV